MNQRVIVHNSMCPPACAALSASLANRRQTLHQPCAFRSNQKMTFQGWLPAQLDELDGKLTGMTTGTTVKLSTVSLLASASTCHLPKQRHI
eukprot:scaffold647892_cov32-Prasinocladus_malaysianus.AAC.1